MMQKFIAVALIASFATVTKNLGMLMKNWLGSYKKIQPGILHQMVIFEVGQFNSAVETYLRPTFITTVRKIWDSVTTNEIINKTTNTIDKNL